MLTSSQLYTDSFKATFQANEEDLTYDVTIYDRRIEDEFYAYPMEAEKAHMLMCSIVTLGEGAIVEFLETL